VERKAGYTASVFRALSMPKVVPGYKAEARARIANAAERLFSEKGFRATTMDDVAARLGVSKGALYLYFPSKVDLLREIQAGSRRVARSWIADALARPDPVDALVSDFERMTRRMLEPKETALWFEILAEAAHDPAIRSALRFDHDEDRRMMRRFVAELERQGRIASDTDAELLAFLVLGLFRGAVWDLSVGYSPTTTARLLRAAIRTILPAPGARSGEARPPRAPSGRSRAFPGPR